MNPKRLEWDFAYHPPDSEAKSDHETIRADCMRLAKRINAMIPDSREKSLAITKLEEVMFWANAAIARRNRPDDAA